MSFKQATTEAPADADFIGYKDLGGYVIIQRRSDGIFDVCANVNSIGYSIFIAGVSANKWSFWSHDSQQFITGNVEQLTRHADKQEA